MKKLMKRAGAAAPTALLVLGAVTVAQGICMIYLPAGLIAAGVLAMIGGVLLIGGGGSA